MASGSARSSTASRASRAGNEVFWRAVREVRVRSVWVFGREDDGAEV